jgi:hypothetical protein
MSGIMVTTNQVVERAIVGLKLSGTKSEEDGKFTAESSCSMFINKARDDLSVQIKRLAGDWVIYHKEIEMFFDSDDDDDSRTEKVFWKNPLSENMRLPPQSGWVSAHEDAEGNPKIEYIYRANTVKRANSKKFLF